MLRSLIIFSMFFSLKALASEPIENRSDNVDRNQGSESLDAQEPLDVGVLDLAELEYLRPWLLEVSGGDGLSLDEVETALSWYEEEAVVDLPAGPVRGILREDTIEFLGVP